MFGPDKCLNNKVRLIIRHFNPVSGKWFESHLKKSIPFPQDSKTHLYTLKIGVNNQVKIFIDLQKQFDGSLLYDFEPPIAPPAEIDDPNDKKPTDWDDKKMIYDKNAKKPDDWDENQPKTIIDYDAKKPEGWLDDENEYINDEKAKKPLDWDDDEDGAWQPPLVYYNLYID